YGRGYRQTLSPPHPPRPRGLSSFVRKSAWQGFGWQLWREGPDGRPVRSKTSSACRYDTLVKITLFCPGGPMKIARLYFVSLNLAIFVSTGIARAEDAKAAAPVAKVGNAVLTEDDLRKDMGMNLYQVENQLYVTKKNWVDQKAKSIIFGQAAKEAGLNLQTWQTREIDGKVTPPTQQEID